MNYTNVYDENKGTLFFLNLPAESLHNLFYIIIFWASILCVNDFYLLGQCNEGIVKF